MSEWIGGGGCLGGYLAGLGDLDLGVDRVWGAGRGVG